MVAYRGSENFLNYFQDAEFWLTQFEPAPSGVKVDHGFLNAWLSVRNGHARHLECV